MYSLPAIPPLPIPSTPGATAAHSPEWMVQLHAAAQRLVEGSPAASLTVPDGLRPEDWQPFWREVAAQLPPALRLDAGGTFTGGESCFLVRA